MKSRIAGTATSGLWHDNTIFRQVLGICSVLAVTNLMINCVLMGVGLVFTVAFSNVTVSLLRHYTPRRVRMVVQTLIIACYVIVFKIFLDATLPEISQRLGAYVGLIITNCIVMGRAEGFANDNPPMVSFFDGVFMGSGYALILIAVGFFRELLGFRSLMGVEVLPESFDRWIIMVMAPGAFFVLALIVWAARAYGLRREKV